MTEKPYCPLPNPSKPRLTTGANAAIEAAVLCRTGSSGSVTNPGGRGMRRAGSASCLVKTCLGACAIMSRSGGETSWRSSRLTVIRDCASKGSVKSTESPTRTRTFLARVRWNMLLSYVF